jgi:hypothetical protein
VQQTPLTQGTPFAQSAAESQPAPSPPGAAWQAPATQVPEQQSPSTPQPLVPVPNPHTPPPQQTRPPVQAEAQAWSSVQTRQAAASQAPQSSVPPHPSTIDPQVLP